MSEKVADGGSGLHFKRADPESLAEVMHRAAATPGLWEELRSGIPPVPMIDDRARALTDTYRDLLARNGDGRAGRAVFDATRG
jgi:glycosyltransferase involved in cell wall biosynthesis